MFNASFMPLKTVEANCQYLFVRDKQIPVIPDGLFTNTNFIVLKEVLLSLKLFNLFLGNLYLPV